MYDDRSGIVRPFPEPIALNVVTVLISFHSFGNLPFERAYRYLERERIAKAVLFLYTKIVAVFPYTVVQTPGPRIREEKKVRMRWR